jgi:hypothetical protein
MTGQAGQSKRLLGSSGKKQNLNPQAVIPLDEQDFKDF